MDLVIAINNETPMGLEDVGNHSDLINAGSSFSLIAANICFPVLEKFIFFNFIIFLSILRLELYDSSQNVKHCATVLRGGAV